MCLHKSYLADVMLHIAIICYSNPHSMCKLLCKNCQVVKSLISSYDITGSVVHSKEYRPQAYQAAQEVAAAARYTADGYIEFTTASQVSSNCIIKL
jgi:E3 UFM1-protein ligase 1